jgi:hypothetical protein
MSYPNLTWTVLPRKGPVVILPSTRYGYRLSLNEVESFIRDIKETADIAKRAARDRPQPSVFRCGQPTTKGMPCRQPVEYEGWTCSSHYVPEPQEELTQRIEEAMSQGDGGSAVDAARRLGRRVRAQTQEQVDELIREANARGEALRRQHRRALARRGQAEQDALESIDEALAAQAHLNRRPSEVANDELRMRAHP